MKIFEFSDAASYSGGAAQMLYLCDELYKKNYDITVICQSGSEIYRRTKVPKITLDMNVPLFVSAIKLSKIILKLKPDIVHCHHPKAHSIAFLASFFTEIPVLIVTRRVSFPIPKNPGAIFKYGSSTHLIAVSENIKECLVKAKVNPSKISVIYSGTDTERFNPEISGAKIRKEFKIPSSALVIGMVANYSEWKGYKYFLKACKILLDINKNIFILVAGYGTDNYEIKEIAKNLGIGHRLKTLGFRNDIPDIIASLDVAVNSSIAGEGISGFIREALSMQKFVIATDVGGNSEIVKNYKTGIIVEPRNSQQIADAVKFFINNPEKSKIMGSNGRKLVEEKFSVASMVSAHEKLYKVYLTQKTGTVQILM